MDEQGRLLVQEAYRRVIGLRARNARLTRTMNEFLMALEDEGIYSMMPEYHALLRAVYDRPEDEDENEDEDEHEDESAYNGC